MESPIALEAVPDGMMEVTIPTTRLNDLLDRVKEAFALGVQTVLVVSPRHRLIYLYESFVSVRILARESALCLLPGLPGLRGILGDLFPPADRPIRTSVPGLSSSDFCPAHCVKIEKRNALSAEVSA